MVCHRLLHARIFAEVRSDSHVLSAVFLTGFDGHTAYSVPDRSAPGVAGQVRLHAEKVIPFLCQLGLAPAALQDCLCQSD